MSNSHGDVLIDNLDVERFSKDIEIVKKDKEYLVNISNTLTNEFTAHIDRCMQNCYTHIIKDQMDDKTLEKCFLELTNLIYFLGDKLESLGIELTVASARNQEIFNKLYQEAEGTIKDKQAKAEEGSKYEYFLKAVYESVYKRIKLKMEAAYEMVSTLKRTQMARTAEKGLTKQLGNRERAAYEE
jgi:vacuolar-type H+-ATPase subunit I/STV1